MRRFVILAVLSALLLASCGRTPTGTDKRADRKGGIEEQP